MGSLTGQALVICQFYAAIMFNWNLIVCLLFLVNEEARETQDRRAADTVWSRTTVSQVWML